MYERESFCSDDQFYGGGVGTQDQDCYLGVIQAICKGNEMICVTFDKRKGENCHLLSSSYKRSCRFVLDFSYPHHLLSLRSVPNKVEIDRQETVFSMPSCSTFICLLLCLLCSLLRVLRGLTCTILLASKRSVPNIHKVPNVIQN